MRARAVLATLFLALPATALVAAGAFADDPQWNGQAIAHDTSPPLSSLQGSTTDGKHGHGAWHGPGTTFDDIALTKRDARHFQSQIVGSAPPTTGNWEGVNNVDGVIPPDTNGDVGDTQYVQWVNLTLRIFKKADGSVLATKPGNALWSGFGTGTPASVCATKNQGDPVVIYDKQHSRWIFSQFAFATDAFGSPKPPYYQCIAVSQTSDAMGLYNRYGYEVNQGINSNYFNDYPKFGVWSDGLYMTTNNFNGDAWVGPGVYAFDLAKMEAGEQASFIARQLSGVYEGLLPAHADSPTQTPPAGDSEYIGSVDTSSSTGSGSTFQVWRFKPDFTTPANSTLTGPTALAVPTYTFGFCGQVYSSSCIAQRGTSNKLDPLSDRLMNRLQYRRVGGQDVLMASHTVNAGSNQAGMRWYEIHVPDGGSPSLYQGDTFAPADGVSRWMGSVAMNAGGDIALGYSAAGSTLYPSIRFTGRLFGDPLNTMTLGEGTIAAGGGSQTGYARWGDYSSMSVDPSDDTTFWYTQEYYGGTSSAGWQTRVGSFKLVASGPPPPPPPASFTLSASPTSRNVKRNKSTTYAITVQGLNGFSGSVALSVSGLPGSTTASFSPNPTPSGSTLTIKTANATPRGTYKLTVTGMSGAVTPDPTTTVTLKVS